MKATVKSLLHNKKTLLALLLLLLAGATVAYVILRPSSPDDVVHEPIELTDGEANTISHPVTDVVSKHAVDQLSTDQALATLTDMYDEAADEEKAPILRAKMAVCAQAAQATQCLKEVTVELPDDPTLKLYGQFELAKLYEQNKQHQEALRWYRSALKTAQSLGEEATESVQLIKLSIRRLN